MCRLTQSEGKEEQTGKGIERGKGRGRVRERGLGEEMTDNFLQENIKLNREKRQIRRQTER